MLDNTTKSRLMNGETVYGCFLPHAVPSIAEQLGIHGFDFVVIDAEHGPLTPADVEHMTRAIELTPATPIVRPTTNDPSTILRFLDVGPLGLQVPWVNTAAAARQAVAATKYQPAGIRGLAGHRANRWGTVGTMAEYVQAWNDHSLVITHIETAEAVENIESFLDVDGLDVLFIGPTDLSHSLGVPGEKDHPLVLEAMEAVAAAVVPSTKKLGLMVRNAAEAQRWQERGARYITVGFDSLTSGAVTSLLSGLPR